MNCLAELENPSTDTKLKMLIANNKKYTRESLQYSCSHNHLKANPTGRAIPREISQGEKVLSLTVSIRHLLTAVLPVKSTMDFTYNPHFSPYLLPGALHCLVLRFPSSPFVARVSHSLPLQPDTAILSPLTSVS